MLHNLKKSLSLLLILFAFSCSNDDSTESTPEADLTETEVGEIVTEIVEGSITDGEESESIIDEIIKRINEEEIVNEETIEEITKEIVTEINTEQVIDREMVEEVINEIIDEMMEEETNNEEVEEEVEVEEIDTPTVSNSVVGTYGQLSIDGANVVNENGEAIQLRGMSLFWSQWNDGAVFYNAETIKWLKEDWHATIVRAAMGTNEGDGLGYINNPDTEKAKVFAVIDAAIEEGIYVIVDWHSHNAENQLDRAKEFFSEVAQKYGDYPNIIYEIYNEPTADSIWTSILKPYHEAVIAEIRNYDSNNIIICGTSLYSQRVDEVIGNEINDNNVAYTLHYYSSFAPHQEPLRAIAQKAIDNNIPIFVTEFGVTLNTGNGNIDPEQAKVWWKFLDDNKISWCNWSITNKNESSAALPQGTTSRNLDIINLTTSGKLVYDEMISKNEDFD